MGKRSQVGLFFSYDENWIAGSYYILNLISALNLLPDEELPHLTLFIKSKSDIEKAKEINYPYVDFQKVKDCDKLYFTRIYRKWFFRFFKKEVLRPTTKHCYPKHYFDAIFPCPFSFDANLSKKTIHWIPDFQEEHLPKFFSRGEIVFRKERQMKIATSGDTVIFSSNDVLKDFVHLYPANNVICKVLNFAVTHPQSEKISFSRLQEKYGLSNDYFFCPNQFWAHKNHKIVLEALVRVKNEFGRNVQVVFSGKEDDYRNLNYFKEIKETIANSNIGNNILTLGFIDRTDQIEIMKNAIAIIQPSLFEGWSTVVEDAKLMNQNLIVSSLAVHKEQLGEKATFFDPYDSSSLAKIIVNFKKTDVEFNYKEKQIEFGRGFLKIANA
jgi:Glycosyl transferases group 1